MSNLQKEIAKWHALMFPKRTPRITAKKILEEASELHVSARPDEQGQYGRHRIDSIIKECADVVITCYAMAIMFDENLDQAIYEKLETLNNKDRNQVERDLERGLTNE